MHASRVCARAESAITDFFSKSGKDVDFRIVWFKGGRTGISFPDGASAELFMRNKKEISDYVRGNLDDIPWFGFTVVPHSEE